MLRPDAMIAPVAATEQRHRTIAPLAGAGGGAGFGAVFGALQREITDFIRHGAGNSGGAPAPMLTAEGQALRQQVESGAGSSPAQQQAFLAAIGPAAQDAAERLGVAPELVAAHAALESGWGQRPLTHADGRSTHNLFGIKAGPGWRGEVAEAMTTEFEAGAAVKRSEPFRSYPDATSAFNDYAQMLLDNPRFQPALHSGGDARRFADALARGGYATDPAYADKLARVAARLQGGH